MYADVAPPSRTLDGYTIGISAEMILSLVRFVGYTIAILVALISIIMYIVNITKINKDLKTAPKQIPKNNKRKEYLFVFFE